MLEIRPNCEYCDQDLAADSEQAMICTYECTFCRACVEKVLKNVCPNCGGGFCARPIRPKNAWRDGVSLQHHPASQTRVKSKYSEAEIVSFSQSIAHLASDQR